MERRIIQVVAAASPAATVVFALSDDGSLWRLRDTGSNPRWDRMPDLPPKGAAAVEAV
jgi:hypothetical protein